MQKPHGHRAAWCSVRDSWGWDSFLPLIPCAWRGDFQKAADRDINWLLCNDLIFSRKKENRGKKEERKEGRRTRGREGGKEDCVYKDKCTNT